MTQTYFMNCGSIYSNIFQEFWVNLLVFCKKIVLLIFLVPLDKILRFFCVVIYICIYIYVFNTESLNQEFFQNIWVNLLVFCVLKMFS